MDYYSRDVACLSEMDSKLGDTQCEIMGKLPAVFTSFLCSLLTASFVVDLVLTALITLAKLKL